MSADAPTILYWEMQGRAGAALRMYAEAGVAVNFVSEFPKIASQGALFGAQTVTLAPPIVIDGDTIISQSCATAMYVGNKLGFTAPNDAIGLMHMGNLVDLYERELATAAKDPEKLKVFIEGADGKPGRFSLIAGAVNRSIQGPYYFGEKPSYVDFLLGSLHAWTKGALLDKLTKVSGKDIFAPYTKLTGAASAIAGLASAANIGVAVIKENFVTPDDSPVLAAFAKVEEAPAVPAAAE